jgi:hypothetical protein
LVCLERKISVELEQPHPHPSPPLEGEGTRYGSQCPLFIRSPIN